MEILWPSRGDRLFQPGGYRGQAACVVARDIRLLAVGYKDAADDLVRNIAERGRNDALIFPIVFRYRQCLELQIKAISTLVKAFDGTGEEFKQIHDLKKLWAAVRPRLLQELADEDKEAFVAVEQCINEFHAIDPKGITFRYPESVAVNQIDLGSMKSVMNRLFTFLDAMADQWEAGYNGA